MFFSQRRSSLLPSCPSHITRTRTRVVNSRSSPLTTLPFPPLPLHPIQTVQIIRGFNFLFSKGVHKPLPSQPCPNSTRPRNSTPASPRDSLPTRSLSVRPKSTPLHSTPPLHVVS
ncbi:hypothetical protein BDV96DRAFT_229599 [Lophiotrema nucula]|uniref:Uncharacterized protein n=1 Tax=Lophiotrema nucula TaxID=690887 RepID=A0A6A5YS40_9PLEO|nr:hypothetical protein BDV96DRAFT_229599 [Lophiotrema nucula]